MFDMNQFVESCKGQSASAVKELLAEALHDPESIKHALAAIGKDRNVGEGSIGDLVIFQSPDLTVLKAAAPAKFKSPPHNHTMWAVIGVYDGQENNIFYRRSGDGLETAGGKELAAKNYRLPMSWCSGQTRFTRSKTRWSAPPTPFMSTGEILPALSVACGIPSRSRKNRSSTGA
jgi:predicted metal-dependent enzyme (double-stranded beta helix superfamily)